MGSNEHELWRRVKLTPTTQSDHLGGFAASSWNKTAVAFSPHFILSNKPNSVGETAALTPVLLLCFLWPGLVQSLNEGSVPLSLFKANLETEVKSPELCCPMTVSSQDFTDVAASHGPCVCCLYADGSMHHTSQSCSILTKQWGK